MKVEIKSTVKDGKEYYSLYVIFRDKQEDKKFLVVPFTGMSEKAKLYYYDLLKAAKQRVPTIKGNASGAQDNV